MWSSKPQSLLLTSLLCVSALSSWTAASNGGKPLLTPITKDASTSLYTAPLKDGRPLVLDLSSPAISLLCAANKKGTVTTTLSANATDGKNPLFPVSFPAVATCAPPPAGGAAIGVAGLAPSAQSSFPSQVARTQKVANKMALCLPSDGKSTSGNSVGVAIFGGGPFFFIPPDRGDFTTMLAGTAPFHGSNNGSPGYFVSATGIAVDRKQLSIGSGGPLVVGLSSTTPYTALRPDVYRALVTSWDQPASGPNFPWMQRVAAVAPFERCYNSTRLSVSLSRLGYGVPQIDFALAGGGEDNTFSVVGGNSMVQVNADTACLGFVRGKKGQAPAAIVSGFQLENRLLVIDGEKKQIGFTTFLNAIGLSCSNFNFTRGAY